MSDIILNKMFSVGEFFYFIVCCFFINKKILFVKFNFQELN